MPSRMEEVRRQIQWGLSWGYDLLKPLKAKRNTCILSSMAKGPPPIGTQERWVWKDATQFLDYNSKIGHNLLDCPLTTPIALDKWQRLLTHIYQPRWAHIWDSKRASKEVAFIWSIWHHMVVVNRWQAKILANIFAQCTYCLPFIQETLIPIFWDCIPTDMAVGSSNPSWAQWWPTTHVPWN